MRWSYLKLSILADNMKNPKSNFRHGFSFYRDGSYIELMPHLSSNNLSDGIKKVEFINYSSHIQVFIHEIFVMITYQYEDEYDKKEVENILSEVFGL